MTVQNRQWILARRPRGEVRVDDFELISKPLTTLQSGQVLVRVQGFANAPAMREWMDDAWEGTAPTMPLCEPVQGRGVGVVTASEHPKFRPGDQITGLLGWQEYAIVNPDDRWGPEGRSWAGSQKFWQLQTNSDPARVLGVLGGNGLAAYLGMVDVIKPKSGETIVVSAAAGATGSLAGQIAKLHGARIVGIASGKEKTSLLTERLRFDVGVDRKSPDFEDELRRACPAGISAYFDNTQGEVLDACLPLLVKRGRVAMCGGVGVLNAAAGRGNYNLMHVIWKRARLEGFSIFEYSDEQRKEAVANLASWIEEGSLAILEDNLYGFEILPTAFIDLLAGRSVGRQLVWIERKDPASTVGKL